MKRRNISMIRLLTVAVLIVALGGCASVPSGPSRLALPGTGKNFDQFRADDLECRHFAGAQVGGADPNQAAGESVVKSAALGTAVGAVAGAAIGGQRGAGVGAGTGLVVGALAGTGAGGASARGVQERYDHAFLQCMYARGHKIPVTGRFESAPYGAPQAGSPRYSSPPPPPSSPPPPPPR